MNGSTEADYRQRFTKAQFLMADAGVDALLLTTPSEFTYFAGFLTRFWESPARPWYLILPASGEPVAVIPAIGEVLMARSVVRDIRTWSSPDLIDDGVSLLADTLKQLRVARVGIPSGAETHMRVPLDDFAALKASLPKVRFGDDVGITRRLRMVKSVAEIEAIRTVCRIGERAFARVHEIAREGTPLDEVFRRFQMLCLEEGADWVPYLAGAAGQHGVADVISPANDRPLAKGDVLMLDTGLVKGGYFCDFDRNYSVGAPSDLVASAHAKSVEAAKAGLQASRPGVRACDVFHAMDAVCSVGSGTVSAGRMGHGLGLQLTEWPSLMAQDETVLEAGMVLTLEPVVETKNGFMIVHEENIVVTESGAEWLTKAIGPDMPRLETA
ncbi:MAG: Xaa-Pro peptidase family protein [Pseudomonadota bacterium]